MTTLRAVVKREAAEKGLLDDDVYACGKIAPWTRLYAKRGTGHRIVCVTQIATAEITHLGSSAWRPLSTMLKAYSNTV